MDSLNIRLRNLMANVFEVSPDIISESTSPKNLKEWDSFKHVVLIAELEAVFGIEIDMDDMLILQSFGDILRVLVEKYHVQS